MDYETIQSFYQQVLIDAIRNKNIFIIDILYEYMPSLLTDGHDLFTWTADLKIMYKLVDMGARLSQDMYQQDAIEVYGVLMKSRSTYEARKYVTMGDIKAFILHYPSIHPEVYDAILQQATIADAKDADNAIDYTKVANGLIHEANKTLDHALYPVYCATIMDRLGNNKKQRGENTLSPMCADISISLIKAMIYLDSGDPVKALDTILIMQKCAYNYTKYRKMLLEDVIIACFGPLKIVDERFLEAIRWYMCDCIALNDTFSSLYHKLLDIVNLITTSMEQAASDAAMTELRVALADIDQDECNDCPMMNNQLLAYYLTKHLEHRVAIKFAVKDISIASLSLFSRSRNEVTDDVCYDLSLDMVPSFHNK